MDSVIEMQVSKGNQFVDARLDRHVLDRRRAAATRAGLDGVLDKGPDVDAGGSQTQPGGVSEPAGGCRGTTGTAASR